MIIRSRAFFFYLCFRSIAARLFGRVHHRPPLRVHDTHGVHQAMVFGLQEMMVFYVWLVWMAMLVLMYAVTA